MSTKTVVKARHTVPGRHASANTSPIVNTGGWPAEQMSFTASFFDKPVMYRLKGMKACCGLCSRPFKRPFSTIHPRPVPGLTEEPADVFTHADHGLILEAGQHAAECPALPDLFESAFIEELGLTPEQVRVLEPEARRALLDHYWETSPAVLTAPVLWDRKL